MAATEKTPALEQGAPKYVPARSIRRRARFERLLYGAAALGITVAPQHDTWWPAHLGAGGLAIGSFAWLYSKWETTGWTEFLYTCQKAVPYLSAAAVYLTDLLHPGTPLWEYVLPAGWGLLMAATTPLTHSTNLLPAALPDAPADVPALEAAPPATYSEHRAQQWAHARSTGDTRLTTVTQYDARHPDFWGIVVATAGEAVPDLNATALAAVFDLPPGTVALSLIEGSGPGRKLLTARPTLDAAQAQETDQVQRLWNEKISSPGGAAPGMILTGYRAEANRIALRVAAPDNQLINLNQKAIARAFGYKDLTLVMIETDGLGDGIISLYKNHPLMQVREATVEDLTMRADGTIQFSICHDGRAGRMPLYDPEVGAVTDLVVGAMGSGKSVTLLTILAAERISGVVSIVADAQNGMSLPEADGRVYHFGKGIAATGATLAAFNELGAYREKVSSANGWGSFEIGKPWALVNGTFDELNRILAADADVPRAFRNWVSGLVGDAQATGRKLGKGIRFAAQNIHLAELGDKDKIRANAKNGTVILGRTNSSTTQHMATDGVLPPGIHLDPIPRYFKTGSDIDAAFNGQEAARGPITAGMANVIQGGTLFLSRTFYARKENKTYPGLIALLESAPMPTLTPEEDRVFKDAYAKWLPHAEALLAGDLDTGNADGDAYREFIDNEDDQPSTGSIKDRILDLLADGRPWALKDVRKHLNDVAAGSVNNAMQELREAGHVTTPGGRGTYQITH